MYKITKRFIDIIGSFIGLVLTFPILLIVAILIYVDDPGPVIFKQQRVGYDNKEFIIYKFRSMKIDTPNVATHLFNDGDKYITKIGKFIRKTSLDELPQLFNIMKGNMTIVGPRPALFNQTDLIGLRTDLGIHLVKPGVTGLAQISGRDELSIKEKVQKDYEYLTTKNFVLDIKIIFITLVKVLNSEGVKDE
jgi:O-antigen biosynthesis protein WbqP